MPINIYSVRNHLEENGWELISDTYKNLDTELEMICPKGHKQKQTYKQWRKYLQCDECMAGDPYKIKKNKVPIKKSNTTRILALEQLLLVILYMMMEFLLVMGLIKLIKNFQQKKELMKLKNG